MTNQKAATEAKKRFGKSFFVRNSGSMSSPEKRAAAKDAVVNARAEIKRIDDEVARRLSELDWYQELQAQRRANRDLISKTEGNAHFYRFSVGKSNGMFNTILGQGDTWEEAFANTETKS